jgi:hypothetical protein
VKDFDKCLLILKAVIGERPRVASDFSIGITTTSGRSLVIDSTSDPILSEGRRDDVALAIITSDEALAALLTGALDLRKAEQEQLFVWGGDLQHWAHLIDAVSAFNSLSVRTLKGRAR